MSRPMSRPNSRPSAARVRASGAGPWPRRRAMLGSAWGRGRRQVHARMPEAAPRKAAVQDCKPPRHRARRQCRALRGPRGVHDVLHPGGYAGPVPGVGSKDTTCESEPAHKTERFEFQVNLPCSVEKIRIYHLFGHFSFRVPIGDLAGPARRPAHDGVWTPGRFAVMTGRGTPVARACRADSCVRAFTLSRDLLYLPLPLPPPTRRVPRLDRSDPAIGHARLPQP